MKPIFAYIDYRAFLRDFYASKKASVRHYSYRLFALKSGINSPSFLKEVIDGKRNLTDQTIDKFCTAVGLGEKEARYFRHLVLFNQATSAAIKQEHYAILRSMHGRVSEMVLGGALFDFFDKWYTAVIRELICLHDFRDNWNALASAVRPAITASQARKAVELLLRLGLVTRQSDGRYVQTETAIVADESVRSLAVRSFTQTMLDHAKAALNDVPKDQRHISGITMGISKASYDVITAEINAFKDRVKLIVAQDKECDRVYHMNLEFFPVSEVVVTPGNGGAA